MSEENRSANNAGSQIDEYLNPGGNSPSGPETKEESGQPQEGKESTEKKPDSNEGGDENIQVTEKQYKELERKLGSQGEELGKYRKLFNETAPLLEKLNNDPELAKAIIEDKIDSNLVQDVLEGKVNQKDAEAVSKANQEVKKEVGEKEYKNMSSKEIEKLIEDKVKESEDKISETLNEREKMEEYQKSISDFIANTPDFAEYAEEIEKLVDQTGLTDIKIAYDAVKGKHLQKQQEDDSEDKKTEAAKNVAANAAGGSSQASGKLSEGEEIDQFIGNHRDPNAF